MAIKDALLADYDHEMGTTRRLLERVAEPRGIDQELLRHATADHAGAADAVLLGEHHARAMAGGDARGAHAARASADDEEVNLPIAHRS